MDELQARHRKEQRDLQALVTQKKKSASKKTRKGVNDECAKLEAELKERQAGELASLNGEATPSADENIPQVLPEDELPKEGNSIEVEEITSNTDSLALDDQKPTDQTRGKKPNRQKARLARRAAERDDAATKAEEEASNMPNLRAKEQEMMDLAIRSRGLQMKEIRADGHCLYSAIADQLEQHDLGLHPSIRPTIIEDEERYRTVRRTAAEYIKQHSDDFVPFLEEPLDEYVRKVGETGEWGGQLELLALAKAYGVNISVLDGTGGVHDIEGTVGEADVQKLWLAYYRHGFGLGEHYNSLRKG